MLLALLVGCHPEPRPQGPPPRAPERAAREAGAPGGGPPGAAAAAGTNAPATASAGPPGTPSTDAPAGAPAPGTGAAHPVPLKATTPITAVVSIHVEGFKGDDREQQVFQHHAELIRMVAREAKDAGIPLSLELSPEFATGAVQWAPGFAKEMRDMGHGLSLHADVGGSPISDQDYVRKLEDSVKAVEALGIKPRYASGICSAGGWVEGMVQAGMEAAVGLVGWCLKSVDGTLPTGADPQHIRQCRTPVECHEAAVSDPSLAVFPWRASRARSWTTPDTAGKLLIIPSAESLGSAVQSPQGRGRTWTFGPAEARALKERVKDALAVASMEHPGVLAWTVSVGARPERGFFGAVAEAASAYGDRLHWTTVDSVIDMER